MARIIENLDGKRRVIKLSTEDVLSIVEDYQRIVKRSLSFKDVVCRLNDNVIFIPEDV